MLRITPITEEDISEEIATAVETLEEYEVSYETNPMSTVVEAEDIEELLAAVGAAHEAVRGDHVSTLLQIDDVRKKNVRACEKIQTLEDELGREATSDRE